MKLLLFFSKLSWLQNTMQFIKLHYRMILALGLIAAFGRTMQLGAFGPVSGTEHVLLEIIIESSRILMFIYVLGMANFTAGLLRLKKVFTNRVKRQVYMVHAIRKLKTRWGAIMLNLVGFLLVAWAINFMIDLLAYETCLYLTLRKEGYISATSSEWTIILFFKNLSVIPLTITFNALFLLWVTGLFTSMRQNGNYLHV